MTRAVWILSLCVLVLAPWALAQDEPAATDARREEILRTFKRGPLNAPPEDAMLLRMLIQVGALKNGVEVGTANGYSAVHMGIAFERTGGKLTTIEIDPKVAAEARDNLARAGLAKTVSVVEGDALKVLPKLEGEYDFVFIDAVKRDTLKYFEAIRPRLAPRAVVVVHNAVTYASAMQDYLDMIQASKDYETVIVRTAGNRDGMSVAYRKR
ncbi:MAG: putative O-methyltransferase [Planctomycetes bacterium ADurb.Bin126]|nr:MAG: putative O-methyltransferase [Planctomycetes bacterium ADurb.Bin126]HOD80310.1 class I SAM-dependent methyltransferase [Phycisphaerae bacterium]HQL72536.1 class I SAM-dependent methyltransferase [Phycisphaerae bacterium]